MAVLSRTRVVARADDSVRWVLGAVIELGESDEIEAC